MWYFIFFCSFYISVVNSSKVPFITRCRHYDTKCMIEQARKTIPLFAEGIPDLNVQKMEPLKLKHIDATSSNLKLIISDAVLTGAKNCEPKKISRDIKKSQVFIEAMCTVNLDGKYVIDGKLFIVPIKGDGDLHVAIRKILLKVEADLDFENDKEGIKHWKIKSWRYDFTLHDKSDVIFDNLFPENELLRRTVTELIKSNGNDVILEIGRPVIKAIISKIIRRIQNLVATVPFEDLAYE